MATITPRSYDPRAFKALTFHSATTGFRNGTDTPRDYLERCLETIAARETILIERIMDNQPKPLSIVDAWAMG